MLPVIRQAVVFPNQILTGAVLFMISFCVFAQNGIDTQYQQTTYPFIGDEACEAPKVFDRFLVTGYHIKRIDLEGPAPLLEFDRSSIMFSLSHLNREPNYSCDRECASNVDFSIIGGPNNRSRYSSPATLFRYHTLFTWWVPGCETDPECSTDPLLNSVTEGRKTFCLASLNYLSIKDIYAFFPFKLFVKNAGLI